jgi:hypothetical protein
VTGRRIDLPDQARYPADDVLHAGGVDRRRPELYDPAQVTLALAADRAELKQYYEGFAGGWPNRRAPSSISVPAVAAQRRVLPRRL